MEEDLYLEYVKVKAVEVGKIFILDSGEGNDYYDEERGWDIEDLSGWLIDEDQIDKFKDAREQGHAYDEFGDNYYFAEWEKDINGKIIVKFKQY